MEKLGRWYKTVLKRMQQENGFLAVTRKQCRFNTLHFVCGILRRFAYQEIIR